VDLCLKLRGEGVGGYYYRIREAVGPLEHRLLPGDVAMAERARVGERQEVVHGDDRLVALVVDAVVTQQRGEEARRVHHAAR
jgi:hypothetical protein